MTVPFFFFGDAVFEMHRTFNHKHFLLDEHIDRLFMSMKSFCIPIDKTREEIKSIFDELMARNAEYFSASEEYRFMVNVSRGPLSIYSEVWAEWQPGYEVGKSTWIFNVWPLSRTAKTLAHFYETGANAVIVPQRQVPAQYIDPKVKSRSRAHLQLANIQASKHGVGALALLLDDMGFVCEGTGSNFLLVKDKALIIPERRNMLRGCSMEYILDVLVPQLGLSVVEKNFEPYDVLEADEAMFTGTFHNILPCNRLNGQIIRGRENCEPMGPVTQSICERWAENVGIDFIEQIKSWRSSPVSTNNEEIGSPTDTNVPQNDFQRKIEIISSKFSEQQEAQRVKAWN